MARDSAVKHTGTLSLATQTPVATACRVKLVVLTPGANLATMILRDGGSGGTIMCNAQVAANGNSQVIEFPGDGLAFGTNLYVALAGGGVQCDIYYKDV